jgi:magnesium chelatase subunit D
MDSDPSPRVGAHGVAFPFSAVIGQDEAKLALLLNALEPRIGGVLLRGEKGSAKSTLARALAALLPGAAAFVELPIGASEDRVVGTLDLEAALREGRHLLRPGLLAAAHGGVLYVDEVNLLPDHLVDVLLDVAASGVNRVEREGISASHPARFVLVGSMNPEEGELRPQLLDRFGLAVEVVAPRDGATRAAAVARRLSFDADPVGFAEQFAPAERALRERLASTTLAPYGDELVKTVAHLCVEVGAEGLRADLVICRAAAALAAWEGRERPSLEDVRRVAPLALAHRRRRSPFEEPGIDQRELDEALEAARENGPGQSSPSPTLGNDDDKRGPTRDEGTSVSTSEQGTQAGRAAERLVLPGPTRRLVRLEESARHGDVAHERASGRRSLAAGRRGRLVGEAIPDGPVDDVALGATVRAASARRALGASEEHGPLVAPEDLRAARREQRSANLVVLVVDGSASMGVERRMEAVKGAAISLLLDAYQRRDRVALVTFAGEGAKVALRPTSSVEVARARLFSLPTGGKTPLAAGISTALSLALGSPASHRPLLVLISDGRATLADDGVDPLQAARQAAQEVARRRIPAVVVDVEEGPVRLGLAGELAEAMRARLVTLEALSAGSLAGLVRASVER